MIAVDTSALGAIFFGEPEAEAMAAAIRGDLSIIGAPTLFEFRLIACKRLGERGADRAEAMLARLPLEIAPWTADHVTLAQEALLRFGGRPARLNFGDCMAYALARSLNAPLLFKGDDFRHTDIKPAL